MSLRSCVLCVVGDLSEDAFASHWWTETNVHELLKDRKIKLLKKPDKSVTHLICSRSAYRSRAPEVISIQKIQDRRIHKKPQIVTYDWLEDSIDAKKPVKGTDKYDPGKPRDVDGMVAAWKETKFSGNTGTDGPTKVVRKKTASDANVTKKGAAKFGDEIASGIKAISQGTSEEMSIAPRSTKLSIVAHTICKPKKELPPEKITEVYRDQTDDFPYRVELTAGPTTPEGEKFIVELIMTKKYMPQQFRFQTFRLDKKGKETYRAGSAWVHSAQEALGDFAKHFMRKTGYAWDQRLVRDGEKGRNGGKWLYKAPVAGKPRGTVPPKYTPGHPECVKLPSLLPKATHRPAGATNTREPLGFEKATASTPAFKRRAVSDPPRQYVKASLASSQQQKKRKFEGKSSSELRAKVQRTTQVNGKKPARMKH